MSKRGWRWRVLAVYQDAFCSRYISSKAGGESDGWAVAHNSRRGGYCDMLGKGITAPMAWLDAWKRIEAERGGK